MDKTPIYKYPASYAREQGELPQYRASKQSLNQCAAAIDKVISEQWDGWGVPKDAAEGVLKEYGPEKVSLVLAFTAREREMAFDERFSGHNLDWAKTIPLYSFQPGSSAILMESHSTKLDSFIDVARESIRTREQEKTSVKKKLRDQPDAPRPPAKGRKQAQER